MANKTTCQFFDMRKRRKQSVELDVFSACEALLDKLRLGIPPPHPPRREDYANASSVGWQILIHLSALRMSLAWTQWRTRWNRRIQVGSGPRIPPVLTSAPNWRSMLFRS